MKEYFLLVFAICVICGVVGLLCYGSGKAERLAVGIIALYVIVSPIATGFDDLKLNVDGLFPDREDIEVDTGYATILEEAFIDGVKGAINEKFSIKKENIRVKTQGFDPERMTCDSICVTLRGIAVLADVESVVKYLNELSIGECSVEIEIG